MKEKIMELLEKCHEGCTPFGCEECKYKGVPACGDHIRADVLIDNGFRFSEPIEGEASLNYEAEYHRLLEEREYLTANMEFLRSKKESLESEFIRLRAQMDVVYLIFGGK